jgi:hypothetical protein
MNPALLQSTDRCGWGSITYSWKLSPKSILAIHVEEKLTHTAAKLADGKKKLGDHRVSFNQLKVSSNSYQTDVWVALRQPL